MKFMSDVFLSAASASARHAYILANELQTLGVSTGIYGEEMLVRQDWEQQIRKGIRDARAVVFLVDANWLSSEISKLESMTAPESSWSDKDKILIPVLIRNAKAPAFLRHIRGIKVEGRRSDWPRAAKEIAKILNDGVVVKDNKAAIKEQSQRLNLIEKQASLLWSDGERAAKLKSVT